MGTFSKIVENSDALSSEANTIHSQLNASVEAVSARTAASWLLGAGHGFAGTTIQDALDENESAIAAGLTVGSGTTAKVFKLNTGHTGAPSDNCSFGVERGAATDVYLRWNETTDLWDMHNGSGYSTVILASNAESLLGSTMAQPFDRVYNACDFNPHEISGLTATNVAWASTSDPTYFFPSMNVYSSQTALHYYAFDLLIELPTSFGDWKSATALVLYYRTETVKSTQNHLDLNVRHKGGILATGTSCSSATQTNQVSTGSGNWTTLALAKADLTGGGITWTAGDYIWVRAKLESKSSKYVELGPMILFGERT